MLRREFLGLLGAAGAAGFALGDDGSTRGGDPYDLPAFGNVSLLHFTDTHAQLRPVFFREPAVNVGVGALDGQPPHLVGTALLRRYGIPAGTREAHAFSHLDFQAAAHRYGRVGGFAHLATLVKRLRAGRPGALLLDGGDTWQGSATALWTQAQDMVDAQRLLGVDCMTGHWEFTLGAERVQEIVRGDFAGRTAFLAQNVATSDFGDIVFPSHALREVNGHRVAIVGQAFPYTPVANPRHMMPDWDFGVEPERLQGLIDTLRAHRTEVVVLLSHNGMDLDLALARRIRGLDAILGGHTHDAVPIALQVQGPAGRTLVTNAGSHGKFLAVLDLDVRDGRVSDFRHRLLPVFSDLLPADPDMAALIDRHRAPFRSRLEERLADTEILLYRRGNFGGTFDRVILDAMLREMDCEIALSPGFRWGPTVMPGDPVTREDVMSQTAITYPATYAVPMTGRELKSTLEDVADNLFNPDPFRQQGGDMVRVGGMRFRLDPYAPMGRRISGMTFAGEPVDAGRVYKVAAWAGREEGRTGPPIWDVVERHLRDVKTVVARPLDPPYGQES
jgi:S-sulfosulfanyl-L-cysteine sulfohydrolase